MILRLILLTDRSDKLIGDIVYKLFALFPAETGVGYRFPVNALLDLLRAVLDIALDHKALHHFSYIAVMAAAMEHFMAYAYLFKIFLSGICVVDIDDHCEIFKSGCRILIVECSKILVVIIRDILTV